jgi:hypothetical protein
VCSSDLPDGFGLGTGPWPCARTRAVLAAHDIAPPRADAELLARYITALRARGLLP